MASALLGLFTLVSSVAAFSVGDDAPLFSLPRVEGKKASLADYRGKYVVLEWVNHGCPFVKKHYDGGHMQALQKKWTQEGIVWLSVASSAPGKQGHFKAAEWKSLIKEKDSAATAVLLDPSGAVGRLYDAKTTPHMFVIDPQGKVIYRGAIDSVPSTDSADIAGAVNYVDQALSQALKGEKVTDSETKSYGCSVKY